MAIQIKTAADLQTLLSTLADELVDANVYLRMYQDLGLAANSFHREFNQARTFWGLTLQAHLDAAIFRLCKIYDDHGDGLNLLNLLGAIRANMRYFSEDNFRERMKGNPFVDSLAAESRMPDSVQLEDDIRYVSQNSNPQVRNLVKLRNKLFAHRASREVLAATDLAATYPLSIADTHDLLAHGMEIVNRYSQLFSAQTHSTQMVGHDDYKTVLAALRSDLERRRAELERQRKSYDELAIDGPESVGPAGPPQPGPS